MKRFWSSSWGLPLGAAAVLLVGFLLMFCCVVLESWLGDSPVWLNCIGIVGFVLFLLGVVGGLLVPLWLLVMTVRLLRQRLVTRTLCCWGASGIAAVVAMGVGMGCLLQMFGGGPDLFVHGLTLPADKEFVLPRNLTFFINMEDSPRAKELRALKPELPELSSREGGDAAPLENMVPNLEKLSRVAPELLQEYMLRALYAEATNPRFNSPVLAADASIYPAHENDPQTQALRGYLSEHVTEIHHGDGRRESMTAAEYPAALWRIPLQNGWYIAHTVTSWHDRDENPAEDAFLPAALLRLDAAMASLAANPTREQLDMLLPPTPEHPFLCLWEDSAGCYKMLIVIPAAYEAGSFELRAHEYTKGKRISFRQRWRDEVKLGDVCRLICSDDHCLVYSGDWGEYYGSEWEIWFTPATGGEARCVSRQPFLMMGWQH